jgi:hypothetical protein
LTQGQHVNLEVGEFGFGGVFVFGCHMSP